MPRNLSHSSIVSPTAPLPGPPLTLCPMPFKICSPVDWETKVTPFPWKAPNRDRRQPKNSCNSFETFALVSTPRLTSGKMVVHWTHPRPPRLLNPPIHHKHKVPPYPTAIASFVSSIYTYRIMLATKMIVSTRPNTWATLIDNWTMSTPIHRTKTLPPSFNKTFKVSPRREKLILPGPVPVSFPRRRKIRHCVVRVKKRTGPFSCLTPPRRHRPSLRPYHPRRSLPTTLKNARRRSAQPMPIRIIY